MEDKDALSYMYETRIGKLRHKAVGAQLAVMNFLTDHYRDAAFMSGSEIARTCGVNPAVVTRLAQRLGYSGSPQLLDEIRSRVKAEIADLPQA